MSLLRWLLVAVVLAGPWWRCPSYGCFAVIVGREASADGSVLVGHNEQNSGRRFVNFRRIPRRRFGPGALVRLRRGGRLPQVERTWAFLWSENPGPEFSDAYLNEWGVAVVSDACPTREDDYETLVGRGEIRDGGIGYMLRRLVAERARTAREGAVVAGNLVERFGYVGSGRTYVIADPREVWLVAVVCGRRWAAQRVPDDVVVVLPNIHIIGEVDTAEPDRFMASPDLVSYASRRGWFNAETDGPFNFRRTYRRDRNDAPDLRRWWARGLVGEDRVAWPPKQPPPLGLKPKHKLTVADVIEILRDTSGPGRKLSTPRTQEGAVLQLRRNLPREIGCVYWRTTAEPSTSVLLPWYLGVTETPARYYRVVDVETHLSLAHHFEPPPGTFTPDGSLDWWTFKALQDVVREDFEHRAKAVRAGWRALESRVFRRQAEIEKEALALWQTDQDAAREYLTRYCAELAAAARREAERMIDGFAQRHPD